MPTEQPSSAPQADAPQPNDDLTAAAVLHDDTLDGQAGGGGLGGADAGAPVGGDAAGRMGAATPNSPIDAHLPHDGGKGLAGAESLAQAAADPGPEPGHDLR